MNLSQTVQIIKILMQGPLSKQDLARRVNAGPKPVARLLNEMKAQGMIYVIGYTNDNDGRNRVRVYAMGEGEDAPPERVTTQEERSRKSYAKKLERKRACEVKTTFVGGVGLWQ